MSTTKSEAKAYQQFIAGGWADATDVIDEFTEVRWITVQSGSHPFPF